MLSARLNLLGTGQGTEGWRFAGRLAENPRCPIVRNLPAVLEKQVIQVPSLGREDPLA